MVEEWDRRKYKELPLYVDEPPPASVVVTRQGRRVNVMDVENGLKMHEIKCNDCNTHKDKPVKGARTAGIYAQVAMCGVAQAFTELYRSESKTQVLLVNVAIARNAAERGLKLPMITMYDDACHELLVCMGMMGQSWAHACVACADQVLETFHFKGHIDPECLRELNPFKRPWLNGPIAKDTNSPVCEQFFSKLNKCSGYTKQKSPGRFRLFYFITFIRTNNRIIARPKGPADHGNGGPGRAKAVTTVRPSSYLPDKKGGEAARRKYNERLTKHNTTLDRVAKEEMQWMPKKLMDELYIDPAIFRDNWDELVAKGGILYESREQGASLSPAKKRTTLRNLREWYLKKIGKGEELHASMYEIASDDDGAPCYVDHRANEVHWTRPAPWGGPTPAP